MARKTKTVVISGHDENRDNGKHFVLTEMPAAQAEKWAFRALTAMGRNGMDVPDDALDAGVAGLLAVGVSKFLGMGFADAEVLLDEMFGCVQFLPDPARPEVMRALVPDDTEEVSTRFRLRSEVLELHTGFSGAAILSTLGAALKPASGSSATSTSPRGSAPRSPRGSRRSKSSKPSTA